MIVLPAPGSSGSRKRKRLPRQHLAVHGGDLVGQRLNLAGGDRKVRIEQVGKADALCLRRKTQLVAISVEGERAAGDREC